MAGKTESRSSALAVASPIALALFGFTLALYGIRYTTDAGVAVGLNYALLFSGLAEIVCGILCLFGVLAYPGYVLATFGFWVIGLYFVLTSGVTDDGFTTQAVAWYVVLQVVPTVYLAVPAFVFRSVPFMITFVAIAARILCLGFGVMYGSASLPRVSGWFAFVAAAAIWFVAAGDVLRNCGIVAARRGAAEAPGRRTAPHLNGRRARAGVPRRPWRGVAGAVRLRIPGVWGPLLRFLESRRDSKDALWNKSSWATSPSPGSGSTTVPSK